MPKSGIMKKYLIIALLITQILSAFAQQLPQVSYYMYDHTRTNPGSFGSKDMICASFIQRNGFIGMPGAPTNFILNANMPFKLFGAKHGAGLTVYNETIGFYSDIDIRIGYAYRFNVGDGALGVGFSGGLRQRSIDGDWVGNDGDIDVTSDPYIPQEEIQTNSFGFGLGAFYRAEDVYFGASVKNVYASEIDYASEATSGGELATEQMKPHYYVTAGYIFQLRNPAFEVEPSVQFCSDAVSVTFDLNGTVTYNKKIWGGVTYRAGSAASAMAGLSIMDGLKVGMAYDFWTSQLRTESAGSYEILLNYCFKVGVEKAPQRYKSIRYL